MSESLFTDSAASCFSDITVADFTKNSFRANA